MGTNGAIDVAIALILLYLLLSLIVTVINEQIATALDLRAETLSSALAELLDDPTLKADFENHGLIAGLNAAVADDRSSIFFRFLAWLCRQITRSGKPTSDPRVSYLSGKTFALAILGSLDPTKPIPLFDDMNAAVEHMPDTNIRDALLAQLATANGSLEKLRDNIATWFDSSMDRVSGVYKRSLKRISFVVGLLLVVVVNADTLTVSKSLWNDASLRAGMVQNASAVLGKSVSGTDDSAIQKIKSDQELLRPLPLGWGRSSISRDQSPDLAFTIVAKIIGLLFTALAISLGAPFWFDLLGMFMQIRGTGEKPEKTQAT
jgi:hypothetical protein